MIVEFPVQICRNTSATTATSNRYESIIILSENNALRFKKHIASVRVKYLLEWGGDNWDQLSNTMTRKAFWTLEIAKRQHATTAISNDSMQCLVCLNINYLLFFICK